MNLLTEAKVLEKIEFIRQDETSLKFNGTLIQAHLGLTVQELVSDEMLQHGRAHIFELVRTELAQRIIYQIRTKELEEELSRLREIAYTHDRCEIYGRRYL